MSNDAFIQRIIIMKDSETTNNINVELVILETSEITELEQTGEQNLQILVQ
ncbi:10163_t:CDS:2 [Gigaspora margarita]|uniref:10163_t:CDS:1 n=1 Tax=Gigaspora margarita TaxID=4874 RepID=A0ABN7UVX7_GIGMA|nr:10163_t:CDS:2 [Gigaspora margarita]